MSNGSDNFDQASELQDAMNTKGLAKIREALGPETHPDFDGSSCVRCGCEIPAERLAMQKVRCVRCQTLKERDYAGR